MNSFCCASVKCLIYAFNLIFALGGLGIIIFGSVAKWQLDNYGNEIFQGKLDAFVILMIVVGSIIFLIPFLGCCGAIRESNFLLYTYILFLFVVIGGIVVGAVLAFTTPGNVSSDIRTALLDLMQIYHVGGEEGASAVASWNGIQEWYKCCGVDGPNDWPNLVAESIPASCSCQETSAPNICTPDHIFSRGCYKIIMQSVTLLQIIMGGTAVGFAVLAVIGIFLTCMLSGAIKKDSDFYKRMY